MNAPGATMTPLVEGFLAKYGAVLLGVGAGTAAKYRLSMGEGRKTSMREVLSDLLLVPMVVLLAAYVGAKLGAEPHLQAVIAAFFAVSSDRIIRMLRERFLQRVDDEVRRRAEEVRGEVRQEVQAELSGQEIIRDNLSGKAPVEYKANKVRRFPRRGGK